MTYSKEAEMMAASIKKLAESPEHLANFESYLTSHFGTWLEKYANTPGDMAAEFKSFSEIDFD